MISYHITVLRENSDNETSMMQYFVILEAETADVAASSILDRVRSDHPQDAVTLVSVKRNEKKIKPPVAPGRSFLFKSDRITGPVESQQNDAALA